MKRAIILAAGTGSRLGELARVTPKCLLEVDSDRTLLDYSLGSLLENKINEIIIVTGFQEEKLKKYISKQWANKFSFRFIFNEKFSEYNNIYSAYLAKDIWDDETVLLNSDIIFDPHIFANLRQRANNSEAGSRASYLVIDNTKKLSHEDMKIDLNEYGHVNRINKNLNPETSFGEYIGITYLRGLDRIKFLESLGKNTRNNKFDLYYEDALDQILSETPILPCSTQGLSWTEVDTIEDYENAKQIAKQMKVETLRRSVSTGNRS